MEDFLVAQRQLKYWWSVAWVYHPSFKQSIKAINLPLAMRYPFALRQYRNARDFLSLKILTKLELQNPHQTSAYFPFHQVTILISQSHVKQAQKTGANQWVRDKGRQCWIWAPFIKRCWIVICESQDYKCEMCFASKVTSKGRKARRDPTIVQERVSWLRRNIFWKNLSLEKMPYLINSLYKWWISELPAL